MNLITTFTKEIYEICGHKFLESFLLTQPTHKLYVFFEDETDLYTEKTPDWLSKYNKHKNIKFFNLMNYEYKDLKIVDFVDSKLKHIINFTDEYSSPRSVKWFRPVASIQYASELIDDQFCWIDADCILIKEFTDAFFDDILGGYNMAYLGREFFKVMRHGAYIDGKYVCVNVAEATKKDTHTETGFIGFNVGLSGTRDLILSNFDYWVSGEVLSFEFKTDCHTLDAAIKKHGLKYNNLCEPMGEISPIGSKVVEASVLGEFLAHEKGMIGPILYERNSLN